MSNAYTPEMMAQSMAESLLRENKSLKEAQRKDSEDMLRLIADIRYVAGIAERGRGKPLEDGEKFTQAVLDYVKSLESQLSTLKEQNALLTVQVQGLVSIIERIDSHTDSTNDGVTHDLCQEALTAHPQPVKSEDARDADFDLEAERIFTEELTGTVGRINPDATCIDDIFIFDDALPQSEDARDGERWRKCKTMPKEWWISAMAEAGLKGGRSLDEAIDSAISVQDIDS